MKNIKTMSGEEFRENGYLQEVNRRFFHPVGLAIAIIIDDKTKKVKAIEIQDHRDDPEGLYFGINDPTFSSPERVARFIKNKKFVDAEIKKRSRNRKKVVGSVVETIPEPKETK